VGGIAASEQSMLPFYEAGADGFGLGTALFHPNMSDNDLRNTAQRFSKLWKAISK
jgi:2-dehydro-3-deoxyphosphogalactonate aldolase